MLLQIFKNLGTSFSLYAMSELLENLEKKDLTDERLLLTRTW